jgi:histidine triad (HIT) family protein
MEDGCIFCKIAHKKAPANIVYEDTDFIGFLDISPLNKGHVQLVPKIHYRWTWDIPNFGEYWEAAKKVANAQMKALSVPMVEFLTHGMDVHHAHIWIVPIYGSEAFIDSSVRKTFTKEELADTAEKIRKEI